MRKKIALYGVLTALTLLLGFVESLIPVVVAIPGIKLGLANMVIVFILYTMHPKDAVLVSVVRVLLAGFLFSGISGILYSLLGTLFSLLTMSVLKKSNRFSIIGVSICGGVAHNIGQMIIAAFVTSLQTISFYIPILIIAGMVTGTLIGIVSRELMKRLSYIIQNKEALH